MTLRVRLLTLTLSTVGVVAVTLMALSLDSLVAASIDIAISNSEMAGRQLQSFILHRLSETRPSARAKTDEIKRLWNRSLAADGEIAVLLEQSMVQSRSISEIDVAREDGAIIASSNPRRLGFPMEARPDLRALRNANSWERMTAILASHNGYETRVPLGIAGQKEALFTIQILVSTVMLRATILPDVRSLVLASGLALALAFAFAYWLAGMALRPLARIERLIDDIAVGKTPDSTITRRDNSRELSIIQAKLSLLGERYRGAREDVSKLRTNLTVLEKLDAGTRKHFEDQIALARRLTAINSLTSRVAHEIKNPLNSIALRLEILRSRIADESPDAEPEFAILSEEVTRLDRVVRTFLDFSRPVELSFRKINIADLAGEILQLLEPEAAANGVAMSLAHPRDAVCVEADPDLLRQAILNIAVNAIEAMREGGSLRMEIEKTGECCSLRIVDTGPGIPLEQQDKIFQLYYTTKPRGSGIGLAMTFRAIQLHGGTIEVESELEGGTCFRVSLPLTALDRNA